jgi:hypothetical protein
MHWKEERRHTCFTHTIPTEYWIQLFDMICQLLDINVLLIKTINLYLYIKKLKRVSLLFTFDVLISGSS